MYTAARGMPSQPNASPPNSPWILLWPLLTRKSVRVKACASTPISDQPARRSSMMRGRCRKWRIGFGSSPVKTTRVVPAPVPVVGFSDMTPPSAYAKLAQAVFIDAHVVADLVQQSLPGLLDHRLDRVAGALVAALVDDDDVRCDHRVAAGAPRK